MELVKYKMNLTCSVEFIVEMNNSEEAVDYYKDADNYVFYFLTKGKYCYPPQAGDKAEVIFNQEIDQDSVQAERIFEP